jgi:nitronate monooxygenase
MKLPKIMQGGMGVAISDWRLARAVSSEGHLGVVSGTGLAQIMISRLMDGDLGGHIRRALGNFPFQDSARRIVNEYYVPGPQTPGPAYKRLPMWTLTPSKIHDELNVVSNFVEVFLAREGHTNAVGINLLEKIQMPTMASLYGAMLAGVGVVIMGAGIPVQLPDILERLVDHKPVSYRMDVEGAGQGDDYRLHFDPAAIFPGVAEKVGRLPRPYFLPIISSVVLAKSLIKWKTGTIDGFIVEASTAGGHNAPPRGPMRLDGGGEPIYGQKDVVDLNELKQLGLPFWLAGGCDSPEDLRYALDAGAEGIQVGTAFCYCAESAMDESLKARVIKKVLDRDIAVRNDPIISPTGYPFKVVQLEGTLSEPEVYRERARLCDIGMLRHLYKKEDGSVGFRCPAEPVEQYLAKGGTLEETAGKTCLCNNLCATAGHPQRRKNGYLEPPIVTSGEGLTAIGKYLKPGRHTYTARDVLDFLTA